MIRRRCGVNTSGETDMRIASQFFVAFVLSGCMSYGSPIDQAAADGLIKGKTSCADVRSLFGEPAATTRKSSGEEILSWAHTEVGFAGSSYTSSTFTVTCDDKGLVSDYSRTVIKPQ
jgi:hypothetical protein